MVNAARCSTLTSMATVVLADETLVAAARAGDRAAIDQLLARYQPDVRRFARRVCRSSEDADDAVQHTLVQLSRQMGAVQGIVRLTSWLFTVVKHECTRLIARSRRTRPLEEQHDERLLESAMAGRPDAELALALKQAFGRLDADLRRVVFLRDVEQLSGPEVADELGITVEAMKSRLHRGRAALRRELTVEIALGPGHE